MCLDRLPSVGFSPPTWDDFAKGEPPPEEDVGSEIRPQLTEPEVALWRSQHGPLASVLFVAFPTDRSTRIDLNLSGCSSAADFTSLCPFLPAVADVAFNLT